MTGKKDYESKYFSLFSKYHDANPKVAVLQPVFCDKYPEYFGAKAGAADIAAIFNVNGTERLATSYGIGCHNSINHLTMQAAGAKVSQTVALFSSLRVRYPELYEAALDYWHNLFSTETSPYRHFFKENDLVVIRDADNRPRALGSFNTSLPSPALIQLFIAARVPQESSNKLRSYWLWRKNGFDFAQSLMLAEHVSVSLSGRLSLSDETYPHILDHHSSGISLKTLREGLQKDKVGFYNDLTASWVYSPITQNFAGPNRKTFFSKLLLGKPAYLGHFSKMYEMNKADFETTSGGCVSAPEAVKKLKDTVGEWDNG